MNAPTTEPSLPPLPPPHCDVLVVGAGPAGSACAQWLAAAGWQVVLVDQHSFPRDKVCGDGLIPDAHHALRRLGVLAEVMAQAQSASHVACIGARGGRVEVPGRLAVLPRRVLDDILKRSAERAGAAFFAPWRFEAPMVESGRVVGALLKAVGPGQTQQQPHAVRARWVVLATGAQPMAMAAAGLCERQVPSAVALRGYLHHPELAQRVRALEVVWHPRLSQGYGWIFPCPGGVFNIGVGLAQSHSLRAGGRGAATGQAHGQMREVNLRDMFNAFTEVYRPAAELLDGGQWVSPLKGAPLRCSLTGARFTRPGLLATGEAVGSTYAFTGEGIGKALETGLLAAEALLHGAASAGAAADGATPSLTDSMSDSVSGGVSDSADAELRARYEASLLALKPRYDLYERANRVNEYPWLADLLIWRANRSPRILRRMAGVLEETDNPGRLVSLRGLAKLLLPMA